MKRFVALAFGLALALALAIFAPRALAAEPLGHSGRVVVSTQGDIAIPAGEQADVVVVIKGHADIRGVVNTLVVVEGTAQLTGATAETVVAVRSTVEVGDGTVVYGEIQRFDSSVHQTGNVDIHGGIVDASGRWLEIGAAFAAVLVPCGSDSASRRSSRALRSPALLRSSSDPRSS